MAEYNIGDKFIVEIINKTDEPLAPYINSQAKDVTVYQLKGIPFMLDADTLSNFERFEERKKGRWKEYDFPVLGKRKHCSACGFIKIGSDEKIYNFCPNCGADMRGVDNGQKT